MGRKTQQEADITKANILTAALEIIYEKGYARSTFVDIAKEINLSKGAIYHHFTSKPEMFLALGMQMEWQIDAAIQDMIKANPTLDELQEILYAIVRIITMDPQLRKYYTIVFYRMEWTAELQPIMDFFAQMDAEMGKYILGIIDKAKKLGVLSPDLSSQHATHALMATFDGLLGHCLLESKLTDAQQLQVAETGLNTFFKGLQAN